MGTNDLAKIFQDAETRKRFASVYAHAPQEAAARQWRMTWMSQALDHQILPPGDWWSIWLLLAGRGAGKTRTAAEQIGWWAQSYKATRWLVAAPTSSDVRGTCFEKDPGSVFGNNWTDYLERHGDSKGRYRIRAPKA